MSGFVPGFENDLFISYAHADDSAWIQAFTTSLGQELSRRLGLRVSIWQDATRLRGSQNWQKVIETVIERSAVFVAVLSPSYENSDWCSRERSVFRRLFETQDAFLHSSRFFKVVLRPSENDSHLHFLSTIQNHPFFRHEESGVGDVEFRPGSTDFQISIGILANVVAQTLRLLRSEGQPRPLLDEGAINGAEHLKRPPNHPKTAPMPEPYFYLSYAHHDFDPTLGKFFSDLVKEVRKLSGRPVTGFMDMRLGEYFADQTAKALQTSRVLVALYSPSYFKSQFCGKEWGIFLKRAEKVGGNLGIVPVLWSPPHFLQDMPDVAKPVQDCTFGFPDIYEQSGLRYLIKLGRHNVYMKILTHFAQSIVELGESLAVPPLENMPDLDQVKSAFSPKTSWAQTKNRPNSEPTVPSKDTSPTTKLLAFLCHASGDKAKVRELYRKLAKAGVDPWLDEQKLLPGQEWSREITQAVRKSHVVIVCFSNLSVNKAGYIQKEMRLALEVADEQPEGTMFLIPVRFEECEVPDRFKPLHYADLFEEDGYAKLLNSLRFRANQVRMRAPSEG